MQIDAGRRSGRESVWASTRGFASRGASNRAAFPRGTPGAAELQPNPYIRSDFTEGNEGNEESGQKLRLFVSLVTFCKISEF
jgi:hypothetical protein